jgi:hypothetical protein
VLYTARCIIISQRHGEQPHETPTEKAGSRGALGKRPIKVHIPLHPLHLSRGLAEQMQGTEYLLWYVPCLALVSELRHA